VAGRRQRHQRRGADRGVGDQRAALEAELGEEIGDRLLRGDGREVGLGRLLLGLDRVDQRRLTGAEAGQLAGDGLIVVLRGRLGRFKRPMV
jgi:hypothetical protein